MQMRDSLDHHFRGEIRDLEVYRSDPVPAADDLELCAMAGSALNYLRGNPDPARNYECKFSLGPLGIPAHVPLLASNPYGFDPIALGDTDCRMDWQCAHMREMAGDAQPEAVELRMTRNSKRVGNRSNWKNDDIRNARKRDEDND
jgi:hypothetical protein